VRAHRVEVGEALFGIAPRQAALQDLECVQDGVEGRQRPGLRLRRAGRVEAHHRRVATETLGRGIAESGPPLVDRRRQPNDRRRRESVARIEPALQARQDQTALRGVEHSRPRQHGLDAPLLQRRRD
jgi:hypothetical protein